MSLALLLPQSAKAISCNFTIAELRHRLLSDPGQSITRLIELGYSWQIAYNLTHFRPGTARRIITTNAEAFTVYRGIDVSYSNFDPHFFDTARDRLRDGQKIRGSWVSPDFLEALSYSGKRGILLQLDIPHFAFRDPHNISAINPQGYWEGFIPSHYMNNDLRFYTRRIGIIDPAADYSNATSLDPFISRWLRSPRYSLTPD